MRHEWAIAFAILPLLANGQQNLVPNPSFEEYVLCPSAAGDLSHIVSWKKVGGGAITHFHECGAPCCSVPVNTLGNWGGGGGYARTGQAYLNIAMWYYNAVEGGFLGAALLQPLVNGKKYDVTFYLSLMDSVWYAGKNIGAYFSTGQPDGNTDNLLSLTPQVRYMGDFLTDKDGWMEVSGSFIAQGGEDFISLGNFDGYQNSEALFVGGAIPPPALPGYWEAAYYFIDDVSVIEDRSIGVEETEKDRFSLRPNPANETVTVEAEHGGQVTLYDMAGRAVLNVAVLSSKETIGIGHLPMGVYVVAVEMQDGSVARKRLVKQ